MIARVRRKIQSLRRLSYDVPWCVPAWGRVELAATVKTFATGTLVEGPGPDQFAAAVCTRLGLRYALPTNRGRTAIEMGLRAMGIGNGDDVVIPSLICSSVLDAVRSAGAAPVFADVDETLNVNRETIAAALTPRTKCVIVAHLFGNPAPIDAIERMLATSGIALMDDAAQALGARCGARPVGSFGQCGVVSCGAGKPLAGAAGGVLVTDDPVLFERARALPLAPEKSTAVAGRVLHFWIWRRLRRYTLPIRSVIDVLRGGESEPTHANARLSNLDALIGLAQLRDLERHAAERSDHLRALSAMLSGLPATTVTDFSSPMAVKLVYVLDEHGPSVDDAIAALAQHGIEAQGGYTPVHRSPDDDARLPITTSIWKRVLTIPLETEPPSRSLVTVPLEVPV
jgi:dTDP-4-amino-4,6-dideoxygalactose transaminase